MIHDVFTLLSLGLTPLTIISCFVVVALWYKSALRSYRKDEREDIDWFIIGVVIGFVGSSVDNMYWGVAWSADFVRSDSAAEIFKGGVYSNTFFRQACTAIAALCHIKAASEMRMSVVKLLLMFSAGFGVLYCLLLLMIRLNWV